MAANDDALLGQEPQINPTAPPLGIAPVAVSLPSFDPTQISYETNYLQGILIAAEQTKALASENNAVTAASANIYGSQVEHDAAVYRAAADHDAQVYTADQQHDASEYGANQQLAGVKYSSGIESTTRAGVASIEAGAQVGVASIDAAARTAVANIDASSRLATTSADVAGRIGVATIDADAQTYSADQQYAASTFTAQANKDASVYGSDQDLAGREYSADQQLTGTKYEADQQLAGVTLSQTQESARQTAKLTYADQKFGEIFPYATQVGSTPGLIDQSQWPYVSPAGVLTSRQVQQQVNSALARNDSRTQAQILATQTELAGRGFSSNSPLLQMLTVGYTGQNLRANTEAETQIRIQSAQANAEQILKASELLVNETQAQQSTVLESEKNQISRQVGFIGALAQLVGGVA